jgi:D-serine dehydratase
MVAGAETTFAGEVRVIRENSISVRADRQIGWLNKGLGKMDEPAAAEDIARLGWNLLREDLSLPSAVLYRDRLQHNLAWMQRFMDAYKIRLAPHGKTTMAPRLFEMQLKSGAWGITLASAHQTMVAHAHGVKRVLLANQLVGRQNMETVAGLLGDPEFEFYCLVDSAVGVDLLGEFFAARGLRLNVLLELGVMGGRCGVRDDAQLQAVLSALARWSKTVQLCGVELYEGVLKEEAEIRAFMQRACDVMRTLLERKAFARVPALLSGAGSAWYDVVAEEFAVAGFGDAVEIVLRPGCYLTHDVGNYETQQKRILASNPIAREMRSGLVTALHVWAYVQSIPENELAVVGMGRRDAAFDSGLPTPALHFRPGSDHPHACPTHWETAKMMDQHAYLKIATGDDVRVGDMVAFNISHPCLTFDKWRTLPILDEHYNVVDVVQTYF